MPLNEILNEKSIYLHNNINELATLNKHKMIIT